MKFRNVMKLILASMILVTAVPANTSLQAQTVPSPVLVFIRSEVNKVEGKDWTQYHLAVENSAKFPNELFAADASLPPCGKGGKATRTRVAIYDSKGKLLNEFCALSQSSDLGKLWFKLESEVVPPSYVYIELLDTRTNTKYKSNLAETVS